MCLHTSQNNLTQRGLAVVSRMWCLWVSQVEVCLWHKITRALSRHIIPYRTCMAFNARTVSKLEQTSLSSRCSQYQMMMSGKDLSHVLSWRRKVYSDWKDVTSSGRAFQVFGPTTGKARLSTVDYKPSNRKWWQNMKNIHMKTKLQKLDWFVTLYMYFNEFIFFVLPLSTKQLLSHSYSSVSFSLYFPFSSSCIFVNFSSISCAR